MALSHWTTTTIEPFGCDVIIRNLDIAEGKLFLGSKQKDAVDISEINNTTVIHNQAYTIYACGNSNSGSKGRFDIFDTTHLSAPFASYEWFDLTDSKHKTGFLKPHADIYLMKLTGGNLYDGALGNITLKITRFPF